MLKMLREDRGWTQEHLALVTGLSVRTIQRVEAGEIAAAETLLALASAFDVSPAAIQRIPNVLIREWTEDRTLPSGQVYSVKRFHMTFPAGERPTVIVERMRMPGRPWRTLLSTFTEADSAPEHLLATAIDSFHRCGFEDADPGTELKQVTWFTVVVPDQPDQHSFMASHFTFDVLALRFIASLNMIAHTHVPDQPTP